MKLFHLNIIFISIHSFHTIHEFINKIFERKINRKSHSFSLLLSNVKYVIVQSVYLVVINMM